MHRPAVRHKGCSLEQRPHQSHGLVERRREPGARQILEVFDRPLGIDDRFLRPRQQLIDGFCCIRSVPCVSLRLAGRSGPYARVVAVPAGVVSAIAVPSARRCATRRDRHPHPVCMYPTLVCRRVVRCIIGRDTAEHPKQQNNVFQTSPCIADTSRIVSSRGHVRRPSIDPPPRHAGRAAQSRVGQCGGVVVRSR